MTSSAPAPIESNSVRQPGSDRLFALNMGKSVAGKMEMRERVAERVRNARYWAAAPTTPSRKVMSAAGRPASSFSVRPSRSWTGSGQEMPRAARCSISARK